MRDVLRAGIDKTALPDPDAPGPLLSQYVGLRLEKPVPVKGLF